MIRLNKLTDYGVVVLALMARQHAVATAPQLAQQSGVPLPTVAKILTHLARDGIVTSQRGVSGGYHLARAADRSPAFGEDFAAATSPAGLSTVRAPDSACGGEITGGSGGAAALSRAVSGGGSSRIVYSRRIGVSQIASMATRTTGSSTDRALRTSNRGVLPRSSSMRA